MPVSVDVARLVAHLDSSDAGESERAKQALASLPQMIKRVSMIDGSRALRAAFKPLPTAKPDEEIAANLIRLAAISPKAVHLEMLRKDFSKLPPAAQDAATELAAALPGRFAAETVLDWCDACSERQPPMMPPVARMRRQPESALVYFPSLLHLATDPFRCLAISFLADKFLEASEPFRTQFPRWSREVLGLLKHHEARLAEPGLDVASPDAAESLDGPAETITGAPEAAEKPVDDAHDAQLQPCEDPLQRHFAFVDEPEPEPVAVVAPEPKPAAEATADAPAAGEEGPFLPPWAEPYTLHRLACGALLMMLERFPLETSKPALERALASGDVLQMCCASAAWLRNELPLPEGIAEALAGDPVVRRQFRKILDERGKSDLFPADQYTAPAFAAADLTEWLVMSPLAAPGSDLELMETLQVAPPGEGGTATEVYLFRFRAAPGRPFAEKGWMAGIAGPFPAGAVPLERGKRSGSVFRSWEEQPPGEHAKEIALQMAAEREELDDEDDDEDEAD